MISRRIFIVFFLAVLPWSLSHAADKMIYQSDLTYLGAFRVPTSGSGNSTFEYGGERMTYNPTNNSLYLSGHVYGQLVAEISIPAPVNSSNLSALNTATILQSFADISEGRMGRYGSGGSTCNSSGDMLGGMMVWGSKIIATAYGYYDANNCAQLSHFTSGKTLSATGDVAGLFRPSNVPQAGFIDGWMTPIPAEYQSSLGGKALSGNCGLSILSRTSWGPAAFVFDPDQLGVTEPFTTYPVLYYSQSNPGLGGHDTTSPVWNATTQMRGMHFIPNTKSILYTGIHGTGTVCYGEASECGNDPVFIYKGYHAYPYKHQIWAYNVDDLIAVKNGTKSPWQVQPYSYWTITFSYGDMNSGEIIGGSAYDSTNKKLYIAQARTDSRSPVIHVFSLNVASSTIKTPNSPANLSITN